MRSVLSAPPSADASSTRAASASRASSSISPRELGEPSSSSPVTRIVTPSSPAAAWKAITSPAFMSKQPGPRSTPSSITHGRVASEPSGQTVSWWPSSSTRDGPLPSRQRRWVLPSSTIRSGATPEPGRADLRHDVGRAGDGGQVGRRRLALDQRPQVFEHLGELGHDETFGVARAPKCR